MKVFDGFGLSVDGDLTPEALKEAKKLAADTRLEAEARGLQAYRKYRRLPNGGYATATKHDDVLRIRMVLPRQLKESERRPPFRLPTFASGWYSAEPLVGTTPQPVFYPAETTRVKFSGRDQANRFVSADTRHAGWWTGQMEKLVQFLFAYGKEPAGTPDLYGPVLRQLLTERREGLPRTMSVWHQKVLTDGMTNLYDYTPWRTHGVTVAADGRRWIVEIGDRGVLATPMKYWPYTDVPRFKQLVASVDPEAVTVIEEFGGLPTGESIPTDTATLDAARRAGLVIQLATIETMQQVFVESEGWGPLSEGFGWAFNPSGSAAHAVLYRQPPFETNGSFWWFYWPVFRHWSVELSIGTSTLLRAKTTAMDRLITRLSNYKGVSAEYREIILEKIRYLSDNQVFDLLGESSTTRCFQLLDALVLNPIATGTANTAMLEEGAVNVLTQISVQSPTSRLGGYVDLRPIITDLPPPPLDNPFLVRFKFVPELNDQSSAPIHVWWHGNELKKVRWAKGPYRDPYKINDTSVWPPQTAVVEYMWPGKIQLEELPETPTSSDLVTEYAAFPSSRSGVVVLRSTFYGGHDRRWQGYVSPEGIFLRTGQEVNRKPNGTLRTSTFIDHPNFANTRVVWDWPVTFTPNATPGIWVWDGIGGTVPADLSVTYSDNGFSSRMGGYNGTGADHYNRFDFSSPPVLRVVRNAFGNSNACFYHQGMKRKYPNDPNSATDEGYVDVDLWNGYTIHEGEFGGNPTSDAWNTGARLVRQKRKVYLYGEPAAYGMTVEDQQGWIARDGIFKFVGVV